MNGIFISYRREDSAFETGILRERLANHFDSDLLFTDIDSIPLGVNFKKHIDEQVSQCDIFLAVIGRRWLSVTGATGQPRLQNSDDFVRLEIEAALNRDIPVIPLLLGDTTIPPASELPESLRELAFRNGIQIRPLPTLDADIGRLIRGINRHLENKAKSQDGKPVENASASASPATSGSGQEAVGAATGPHSGLQPLGVYPDTLKSSGSKGPQMVVVPPVLVHRKFASRLFRIRSQFSDAGGASFPAHVLQKYHFVHSRAQLQ